MDRRQQSIIERVKKHGRRVSCLNCSWLGSSHAAKQTEPNCTRIRTLRCPQCLGRLCSLYWAEMHPARYEEKVKAERARLAPFSR